MRFLDFQLDDAIAGMSSGTTIKYVDITWRELSNGINQSEYPNILAYVVIGPYSHEVFIPRLYNGKWSINNLASDGIYRVYYYWQYNSPEGLTLWGTFYSSSEFSSSSLSRAS